MQQSIVLLDAIEAQHYLLLEAGIPSSSAATRPSGGAFSDDHAPLANVRGSMFCQFQPFS